MFKMLCNTIYYIKLHSKLKIDPRMYTFKNLEKNLKQRVTTLFSYFMINNCKNNFVFLEMFLLFYNLKQL